VTAAPADPPGTPASPARVRRRLLLLLPPLLADRPFRRYWSAQTISQFGDQISSVALPLAAVLVLHAGAAQMGYLVALEWLPSLVFAAPAGGWIDRLGHRRAIMIAADLGRAALLASIPASYAAGVLTIGQLYGVAAGAGTLSILFTVSDATLFVAVVPEQAYVDGSSLVNGSRALSYVGGPSLGGLLVQVLSAPFTVAADALSFLGSAFFLSRIHPAEPPADRAGGSLSAGVSFIRHSPVMRVTLVVVATINFFMFMFSALFLLYAVRDLHLQAGVLGLVLGSGAIGGVLGSLVTKRLAGRVGIGWAYVLGCLCFTVPVLLVPLAAGPRALVLGMLFVAEFGAGFGVMVLDISVGSIFAVIIPDQIRSRVMGAFQAVNYGTRPLGALAGGTLGSLAGLRPTLWIAIGGAVAAATCLLRSPLRSFRMPAPGDQPAGS
jgi:MFS family permease